MTSLAAVPQESTKGILIDRPLPDPELGALWDSIILEQRLKEQLLAQSVLNFSVRRKVPRTVLPLHGVILLVGPPGTGKTSLARGLAHRIAESFKGRPFRLIEVEPHSLTSSMLGKSQRAVTDLFSKSIAEAALRGPTIVMLDEVETLAADRSKMSMDANPIDAHRATDAVLIQLDALAQQHPDLLFVATSNFPKAVDSAFTSRCDLVMEIPLPDQEACRQILADCLEGLAAIYPSVAALARSPDIESCSQTAVGLDGRAIRKTVASALSSSLNIALDPNKLTLPVLRDALDRARQVRTAGRLQQ